MRESVTIDGVQLTRAQVERAMTELNKPLLVRTGDFIKPKFCVYPTMVVLAEVTSGHLAKGFGLPDNLIWGISIRGLSFSIRPEHVVESTKEDFLKG